MPAARTDTTDLHLATVTALPAAAAAALQASSLGPFSLRVCVDRDDVLMTVAAGCDALILDGASPDAPALVSEVAADTAVLLVLAETDEAAALDWLQRGVQDVLLRHELGAPTLPLRMRAAIERKRLERAGRSAYATDLDTGLPHQQQLIEHMSQLLALREREPAPMAVLVLRIEGLATTEARLGRQASNALRRKLGVRLRAGVRASDVVASLSGDSFAVLLGSILAPADAARVGSKLLAALTEPFRIASHDVTVATAVGIGQYPLDGSHPDALLRRAVGLAAAAQAQGRAGFANFVETAAPVGSANDE